MLVFWESLEFQGLQMDQSQSHSLPASTALVIRWSALSDTPPFPSWLIGGAKRVDLTTRLEEGEDPVPSGAGQPVCLDRTVHPSWASGPACGHRVVLSSPGTRPR